MTMGTATANVLAVALYFIVDHTWAYDTRLLIRVSRKQDWASGFSLLTSVAPSPRHRQPSAASKSAGAPLAIPQAEESDRPAALLSVRSRKRKREHHPLKKLNIRQSSIAPDSILLVDYFSSTRTPLLQGSSNGKGVRRSERSQSEFQTAVWRFWAAWRAALANCESAQDAAAMLEAAAAAGLLVPPGAAEPLPLQPVEATTSESFISESKEAYDVPDSSTSGIAASNPAELSTVSAPSTIDQLSPIELDLHGMSAPMAAAAVRLTLHRLHCSKNTISSDNTGYYTSCSSGESEGGYDPDKCPGDLLISTNAMGGIGLVVITGRGLHSADGSTRVREAAESVLSEAFLGLVGNNDDTPKSFEEVASQDTQPTWRRAQDFSTGVVNEGALWVTCAAVAAWLDLEQEEISRRLWDDKVDPI